MKKKLLFLLFFASLSSYAQYTIIPDVNFENKLISLGIDFGVPDGMVLTSSIDHLTDLDVSSSSITDLTGIQNFVSLEILNCTHNEINTLDLSNNTILRKLDCSYNSIINLNISKNTNLIFLDCSSNLLESLNVSSNVSLEYLLCGSNTGNFSVLDLSENINLKELHISQLYLSSLDLRKNVALIKLDCNYNNLSSLDLSMNTVLETLLCNNNKLTNLDLSTNNLLTDLDCSENQLTALDISKNNAILLLNCSSNKLRTLNLKNGNNLNLLERHGVYFQHIRSNLGLDYLTSFQKNQDLSCILVDDSAYANTNWTNKKDSFVFYSSYDCSTVTQIPDGVFEEKLIALGIDTDGKNGVVLNSSIEAVPSVDVSNSSISDLTGIQGFTALTTLNCSGNLLKKIDLSKNTAFTTLNCSNNPNLTCIQVADIDYAATNWATNKDATASFSLDCNIYTAIPDSNFEDKLIALGIDRDGKNGKVITDSLVAITSLDISRSSISNLEGIQAFVSLKQLDCSSNELTSIDVTKNTALERLECGFNQISSLNVTQNLALVNLLCQKNQLTALDISKNTKLDYLLCDRNQLTALDVSNNIELYQIWCENNKIKTLDFSKNPLLTNVLCNNNQLVSLNIKNGNNTLIYTGWETNFQNNPDLTCITVDDITYSNTNWADIKDSFAIFSPIECSAITRIPDSNFEDKLIDLGIDTDGKNGFVENTSIALVTSLDVSNASISDLSGIQGFSALTTLNCSGNLLKKVDLSKNSMFSILNCSNNPNLICIQVADVTNATANWTTIKDAIASFSLDCTTFTLIPDSLFEDKLIDLGIDKDGKNGKVATESIASITSLDVSFSSISDLTGIQDFADLTTLNCNSNQLTTLDVSKNIALTSLDCSYNELTSLDVSQNTALTTLSFSSNQLTALDVSKNIALTSLDCSYNQLTSLDVSQNTALTTLSCYSNRLTALDVSKNVSLNSLNCSANRLTSLNLKNGTNPLLTDSNISLTGNPNLKCILVDDVAYSDSNWSSGKDATATFNTDCTPYTLIPDPNFEDKLIAIGIDTDGKNGKVITSSINTQIDLDVSGSSISDLSGIEDFTALKRLVCSDNLLSQIDVSKNIALTNLFCEKNQLSTLEVSQNINLDYLVCHSNQLTNLDVSSNLALTYLSCGSNQLTSLDVSKNTILTSLYCDKNKLVGLNVKNGNNINITAFLATNNPTLSCIQVDDADYADSFAAPFYKDSTAGYSSDCDAILNTYTTIPDSNFEDKLIALGIDTDGKNGKVITSSINTLIDLDVSGSSISDLSGIADFTALKRLVCSDNLLSQIDVSKNIALTNLSCEKNQLSTLEVSQNINLDYLVCHSNQLTNLDVSSNFALTYLSCGLNQLTSLDVSKNTILTSLYCDTNKLVSLNVKNGNNINITAFLATNNPTLSCIQVDDANYADSFAAPFYKDSTAGYSSDCDALLNTYTTIPDSNFEDKLIALGIDTDGKNGKVITSSINTLIDLDISGSSIYDLSGIEDFTALKRLVCSDNLLSQIDVSKNIALTNLFCEKNQLSTVDISQNINLDYLVCHTNQLTSLDVSNNLALTYLSCGLNQLTNLDVSKNTILTSLYCDQNKLVSLNIKNGNNINITAFLATNNPTLSCIQVDDADYADSFAAPFYKDATAGYSSDCDALSNNYTTIPDSNFEDKLIALGIDTDGKNGKILTASVSSLTSLEIYNSNITNLNGIEDFVSLTYLDCSGNALTALDVTKNTALTYLDCSINSITTLDLSQNTGLTDLYCNANSLTSLDVSNSLTLNKLNCSENALTALDVSKNISLTEINCYSNSLTSLNLKNGNNTNMVRMYFSNLAQNPNLQCIQVDNAAYCNNNWEAKDATAGYSSDCNASLNTYTAIPDSNFEDQLIALGIDTDGKNNKVLTANIFNIETLDVSYSGITDLTGIQDFKMLTSLTCSNNSITALDVSQNQSLDKLYCSVNKISQLDLSQNTALTVLSCSFNLLTKLDVSANKSLKQLECSSNDLTYLNIQNGNNANMQSMFFGNFTENPKLTCILVDDATYSTDNWSYAIDPITTYNTVCLPYTLIPDSNFENKLIALGIDTDGINGKVLTSKISTLTSLDVSKSGISSLIGIEDFVGLISLTCNYNQLTSLDLSTNTALNTLHCSSNQLTALDLKTNTVLTDLICSSNQLTSLDISNQKILMYLSCYSNQLTTLDVSNNTVLWSLSCDSNQLTALDIKANTELEILYCNSNQLTSLDTNNQPKLKYLNCSANQLTTLDVSKNKVLWSFNCDHNQLTTLDVSKNVALNGLSCNANKLTSLNLKNGNNNLITNANIYLTENPDLYCILVDDVNYSNTNWADKKDVTANYNVDCTQYTLIPDSNFEDKLIALGIDKDGKNGKVLTESIISVTSLDVSSSSIADLTGIQDFVSLSVLKCSSNQLTALDVSKNVALTNLDCDANQLTILNVSKNAVLTYLKNTNNKLTSLDVSKNVALKILLCYGNQLTALDLSKNVVLNEFNCHTNKLQSLNLKNGKNTLLTNANINLSANANLYCILVDDVTYSNTNWSNKKDAVASFNSVECMELSLPSNNFAVESKGETCLGSNNGEINITATVTYAYKANINGQSYAFTNNRLKVSSLAPGTYTVSITIPGENFEQNFIITIPKGTTITGKSSVESNKVTVEITQGTAPYTVFVDGVEQFATNDSNFSVETKKGGLLEVKTAKACEGTYTQDIAGLEGAISAYPNPTSGSFEIEIPTARKAVAISLYTLDGHLISNQTYTIENGKAQLSLENQASGVYIAKIELDTPNYQKIIKN